MNSDPSNYNSAFPKVAVLCSAIKFVIKSSTFARIERYFNFYYLMLYIFNGREKREVEKMCGILPIDYTPSLSSIDAINQSFCN